MNAYSWNPISEFHSILDYDSLVAWLQAEISSGNAEEITVDHPYLGFMTFSERWYRQRSNGAIWRLVEPDAPFRGVFCPVLISV